MLSHRGTGDTEIHSKYPVSSIQYSVFNMIDEGEGDRIHLHNLLPILQSPSPL